jgi:hypothetical protein
MKFNTTNQCTVSLRIPRETVVTTALVTFTLLFSILSATATAFMGVAAGLAIGVVLISFSLLTSPRATVWVTLIGGLGVAGLVELYLPDFKAIRWIFAFLSICLAAISLIRGLSNQKKIKLIPSGANGLALTLVFFVLAVLISIIAGRLPILDAIVGLKNYFQMWGLMLAIAWLGYQPADARRFINFLGLMAIVQMPFVLHQFFILVPQRSGAVDAAHNIVAVDIVAGTFGGSMTGGGRSANLAVLSALAVTLFFAQWKSGIQSLKTTICFSAVAFTPILLNEAKMALVLLPVGMFLLFKKTITRRPIAWLFSATALAGGLALILVGYANLPGADGQQSQSIGRYLDSNISYNLGEKGYGNSVLNRSTVYRYWFSQHMHSGDIMATIFGHGPGFSNSTSINRGDNPEASRYVGYSIGLTGVSSLLWDTGLLGSSLFALMLFMAYRFAENMRRQCENTEMEPTAITVKIGIVMLGISLMHNDYIAFDVGFQSMLALLLGCLFAIAKSPSGASI